MRPLSQVDPWNGCDVCRELFGRGVVPEHNWTHEVKMWFSRLWRQAQRSESEPKRYEGDGLKGPLWSCAGMAIAGLTRKGSVRA